MLVKKRKRKEKANGFLSFLIFDMDPIPDIIILCRDLPVIEWSLFSDGMYVRQIDIFNHFTLRKAIRPLRRKEITERKTKNRENIIK